MARFLLQINRFTLHFRLVSHMTTEWMSNKNSYHLFKQRVLPTYAQQDQKWQNRCSIQSIKQSKHFCVPSSYRKLQKAGAIEKVNIEELRIDQLLVKAETVRVQEYTKILFSRSIFKSIKYCFHEFVLFTKLVRDRGIYLQHINYRGNYRNDLKMLGVLSRVLEWECLFSVIFLFSLNSAMLL